jgi:hypothetical protein
MKQEMTLIQIEGKVKDVISYLADQYRKGDRCQNEENSWNCVRCNHRRTQFCLAYDKLVVLDRIYLIKFEGLKRNRQLSSII